MRPRSRPENLGAIHGDHRGRARDAGFPMACDRESTCLRVEPHVKAGDRAGVHVRELSFPDTAAKGDLAGRQPSALARIARATSALGWRLFAAVNSPGPRFPRRSVYAALTSSSVVVSLPAY